VQMGLFTREDKCLVGRIGDLTLAWDRHEGGRLSVSQLVAGEPLQVASLTMDAQLEGADLCSASDPDARLIPVEAGPHRLALRVVQRLYDADGVHLGDAMQETWAWSDGSVYLTAMLRPVHPGRGGHLVEASARLAFADDWRPVDEDHLYLAHEAGLHVAALPCGDGTLWAHRTNKEADTR